MTTFHVNIAKIIIKIFSNIPEFSINEKLSEVINHNDFKNLSIIEKEQLLIKLAENHYIDNEEKPFEHYFPKFNLREFFYQKDILDLGCWCGGKAVSNAEKWDVSSMKGLDIDENFIKAARLFSANRPNKKISYEFNVAFGEMIPYKDNSIDGIISYDVFEHVKSVFNTLKECKRILRQNGKLLVVFPSYYTIGESHLDFATKFPFIHWMFQSKVLNQAYYEIIEERGDSAYWYKPRGSKEKWMKYNAGIGVNGTTFNSFIQDAKKAGFSKIKIIPTPIYSVGKQSLRYPIIKYLSYILFPIILLPGFRDLFSHRIVAELTK
jgi:ubiquinone/menaquinone biosynthesis C-methylase UbiE